MMLCGGTTTSPTLMKRSLSATFVNKSSFKRKCSLKKHHQSVHSEERKFCCTHCGSSFKTKVGLTAHLARHSDEKVTCDLCGKSVKKVDLKHHVETHTANHKPRGNVTHTSSLHSSVFAVSSLITIPSLTGEMREPSV